MNYRHAFHAGNHADVLKHVTVLALLDQMQRKDSPFFVLDTHGGAGRYLVHSEESRKTGEATDGVIKLMDAPRLPEAVERYLKAVQADNAPGTFLTYPGSPLLASRCLRAQDRMAVCEMQEAELATLRGLFAGDARINVRAGDGYAAMRALLPPKADGNKIGRGLILIDPPYEDQSAEYPRIIEAVADALARWPQATVAIWYPIKQRRTLQHFFRTATKLPARSVLLAELLVHPDDSPLRLNGSGMLLLNAPWQFDQVLAPALASLRAHLGHAGASHRVEWIKTAV
jgi:23S rRNA (adenine2030-N6)-methyltransferase